MTVATLPQPVRLDIGPGDVGHLFCDDCPKDMAVCGFEINATDWEYGEFDDDGPTCPLCAAVADDPCPRCGAL